MQTSPDAQDSKTDSTFPPNGSLAGIDITKGVVGDSEGDYLWYAWTKEEVDEFIHGSDIDEDFGELTERGDYLESELRPKDDFADGTLEVRWYGSKEEPEGFNPDDAGTARPFALLVGELVDDKADDDEVDEDEVDEDEQKPAIPHDGEAAAQPFSKDEGEGEEEVVADDEAESTDGTEDAETDDSGKYGVQAIAFFLGETEETETDELDGDAIPEDEDDKPYKAQVSANSVIVKTLDLRVPQSSFGYGITTADKYVQPIAECSQSGSCDWEVAAKKFGVVTSELVKSSERLVYSNEDMAVDKVAGGGFKQFINGRMKFWKQKGDVEVPKGTIMVIENVVTTTRKDRDNDVLHSEGADIDPNMPLLWQHVQVQPIGKMLRVMQHDEKGIVVLSAIVDVGSLATDAAKMVEAGMLRISHGFRPLEFRMLEQEQAKPNNVDAPPAGFDVLKYEIMEESLVSVPANTDAVITMFSRNKFEDPVVKNWASKLFDEREKSISVGLDLGACKSQPFESDDDNKEDEVEVEVAEEQECPEGYEWDEEAGECVEIIEESEEGKGAAGCCCTKPLSSRSVDELSVALCSKTFDATHDDLATLSETKRVLEAALKELRSSLVAKYS